MLRLQTVVSAFLALFATCNLSAQQFNFSAVGPSPSANTTWVGGFNLGTAAAGNYTSYFIAVDYLGSNATADQWSSESRVALHGAALSGTPGTSNAGPSGSGTIHLANLGAATGSGNSINPVTNMYWTGNLGTPFASTGVENLFLSARQTFSATPPANGLGNIRVVLNPNIIGSTVLGTGLAAPGSFTDLGALVVGNTHLSIAADNTNTGAAGINWYRFTVDQDVGAGEAFDMYTSTGDDPRMTLFRNTGTGLFAVASNDDAIGFNPGLTFGDADTSLWSRNDGVNYPTSTYFDGKGGVTTIPALNPFGYFAGTAGAATLTAGTEYFLALSDFSGTAPFVTSTTNLTINPNDVTFVSSLNMQMGAPVDPLGTGVFLNIRSLAPIPEPSTVLVLGLFALTGLTGRRRK